MSSKADFMEYAMQRLKDKEKKQKAKEYKAKCDSVGHTYDTIERIRRFKRVTGRK